MGNEVKLAITALGSWVGVFLSLLIGDWKQSITTLVVFMCLDIITGLIISFMGMSSKSHTGYVSSYSFFKGIAKKILMFILISVGYHIDITLKLNIVENAVIYWLIVSEGISIIENIGNVGIKVDFLKKYFEQIKNKGSDE